MLDLWKVCYPEEQPNLRKITISIDYLCCLVKRKWGGVVSLINTFLYSFIVQLNHLNYLMKGDCK